ncbi:MAG TPA: TonB-dependent receptor [Caulobacter sp.]|nr:TonB-dependent receptor [Caulobacter sp.]
MKTFTPTLGGLLLATTALVAPQAVYAQQAAAPSAPQPPAAEEQPTDVEEIVVLGVNIPEPMRETAEVATFLSAEDLKRQGDDTAAEALTRLSGLSLSSGRFVYVRGLGERYSSALLNGSPLPSPEPLQRVVPLDLFPSNVLAGTTVQKTYSPNYPGEFGGGVINLRTLSVPNEPFLTMAASIGGNSETTFDTGITYYGAETDPLGYDDGTREMPKPLQRAIATGNRVDSGSFTDDELTFIGSSFVNAPLNLIQRTDTLAPNFGIDVSAGHSWDVPWGTLGMIGVVGYDNSWRNRVGVQQEGFVDPVAGTITPVTDYTYLNTQNRVVWNGMFVVGLDMGDHIFTWTNLYVHDAVKVTRSREGFDDLASLQVRDDNTEWFERSLINTQVTGEHDFGDNLEVDWRAAFAKTARNSPYEKGIRYRVENGVYYHDASQQQNYTRFGEVEDQVASAGIDGKYTLALSDARDVIFSGGLAWTDNDRSAVQREFRLLALNTSLPLDVQVERVDYLLADYNIGPNGLVLRETTGSSGSAAYKGALEVKSAYAQVDAEIIPLVRVSAGVRYEDAVQSVQPIDLFGGPTPAAPPSLENAYWLPAATLTWNFYEDMQFRVGASKTIARPQFRELAPSTYYDPDSDRLFTGNAYLVDSELTNFDARYEWYFDKDQYFTVGAFYKEITNPVEAIVNDISGGAVQTTYINAPKATLYGVELDAKAYFEFFSDTPWFESKRWLVAANYTYSKSELMVESGDTVIPPGTGFPQAADQWVTDGDPMQGQSEHLANLQFGFEDDAAQQQATVLVTYVSERISNRGRSGFPDVIQDPGVVVDFTFRQGFTAWGREMEFGVEARNLTDEDYEEFQELGGGRVDINKYGIGRSFSISLTSRF